MKRSAKYIQRLQALAQGIATVDVLQSLAVVAETQHLIRPEFGRWFTNWYSERSPRAVVEKVMGAQTYIPNTIQMAEDTSIPADYKGPNMSGKSTYVRQLAMTAGYGPSWVLCTSRKRLLPILMRFLPVSEQQMTWFRVSPTFMVEMMEANNAISHATKNSLILFDELGRGTATYDGMALAQSIIEYIHEAHRTKTLFATHYHELTSLESSLQHSGQCPRGNLEQDGQVTFLQKIEPDQLINPYGVSMLS